MEAVSVPADVELKPHWQGVIWTFSIYTQYLIPAAFERLRRAAAAVTCVPKILPSNQPLPCRLLFQTSEVNQCFRPDGSAFVDHESFDT